MMNGSGEGGGEVVQNNGRSQRLVHLDYLPPGNRFCPTDEEVLGYLRMKVHHQHLPPNRIVELNLYAHHPEQLAAACKPQGDNEWYYFTPRERKYTNGQRPKRSIADGDGYWKATGAEKDVIDSEDTKIGYKRALVFYQGNHPHGVKTNWLMHEFRVASDPPPTTDHSNLGNIKPFDDYVLCKVYKKKGGDTGRKRSRGELTRNEASAPSPKIPKIHPSRTQITGDQFMANGELESPDYPFVNIPHGLLQNHPQPVVSIPMPQISSGCAVFPPPAADASLYKGSGRPWEESLTAPAAMTMNETENGVTVGGNGMGYVEEYRTGYHDQCSPVDNFPNYGFQYQQEQRQQQEQQLQLQQPVVPQNHLQVLQSLAGVEFSWHGLNDYPMQNVPRTPKDDPNPGRDGQFLFPWSEMTVHSSYPSSSASAEYTTQQQPGRK